MNNLRTASVLVLAAAALAASAQTLTAYDSLSGAALGGNGSISVAVPNGLGSQFSPAFSGVLAGLRVAIQNRSSAAPIAFTLRLYADSGSNRFGDLLGTYPATATSATVIDVPATGVLLDSAKKYWLAADGGNGGTPSEPGWYVGPYGGSNPTTYVRQGNSYNSGYPPFAFSVQAVQATPEPSALAALGVGAVALLRRRRRA